jgi:hypothetical protein
MPTPSGGVARPARRMPIVILMTVAFDDRRRRKFAPTWDLPFCTKPLINSVQHRLRDNRMLSEGGNSKCLVLEVSNMEFSGNGAMDFLPHPLFVR